jgi:hypothetical protein
MGLTLSPGKIFLADQRGFSENATQQCYSTFNFGDFNNGDKQPFGNLYTLNDEVLSAGSVSKQQALHNNYLLLVPITGAITYTDNSRWLELEPGEAVMIPLIAGSEFKISNSYPANWVNYLRIEIRCDGLFAGKAARFTFDLEECPNHLIPVIDSPALPFKVHIGRFAGREEAVYQLAEASTKIFSFVIAGAFELQNRLLHQHDGLALCDADTIEAEALSNNAILLLLELK